MATSLPNYKVYVSAINYGCPATRNDNSSRNNTNLTLIVSVKKTYRSDGSSSSSGRGFDSWQSLNRSRSKPRVINDFIPDKSFNFPLHSLTEDSLSAVVSIMDIPFRLDRLYWRERSCKENWTQLKNKDDMIRLILEIAVSAEKNHNVLNLHVSINKEIVLPQKELDAMSDESKKRELWRGVNGTISLMRGGERNSGTVFPAAMWEDMIGQAVRELGGLSLEAMMERAIRKSEDQGRRWNPIPAAESAIEELEDCLINIESSEGSCAICLKTMGIGCVAKRMPSCSHKFHKSCIVTWLKRCRTCLLCRFELSTRDGNFTHGYGYSPNIYNYGWVLLAQCGYFTGMNIPTLVKCGYGCRCG